MVCPPAGRLRLAKAWLARTEFGMISRPLPVLIWVARQLTSTTRPRADGVCTQSPSWNGCSKSSRRPEMIWPTEFCRVRPRTTELMPSAVNRPPTWAPQTLARIRASPIAMIANLATSTKMDGIRRRQLSDGAFSKIVALSPDNTITKTMNPRTVEMMRTGVASIETSVVFTSSSSSAPSGTM